MSTAAGSSGDGLTLRAPAKVNLYLEVGGRRPDGYHEIRTVMQTVDLFDELTLRLTRRPRVTLECDAPGVPEEADNLVHRAAVALRRRFGIERGVHVRLKKRIPAGGGLGGGSSDCAAALKGLARLWGIEGAGRALHEIASGLGSDVPFFLSGGTALCEGRGEKVKPLECRGRFHYVLIMPGFGVSTRRVYANVQKALTSDPVKLKNVLCGIVENDVDVLADGLYNALEKPACGAYERLSEIRSTLRGLQGEMRSAKVLLCGSGSSFLSLHRDPAEARSCADTLSQKLPMPCVAVQTLTGLRPHDRPALEDE